MKKFTCGLLTASILAASLGITVTYNHSLATTEAKWTQTQQAKTSVKNEKSKIEKTSDLPSGVKTSDWNLLLVNGKHPLAKDYKPQLTEINGKQIDKRVLPHYEAMAAAAKKAGVPLVIVSAYRSPDYQEKIYQEQIKMYENQGKSEQEAKKETADYMTKPGTSEHHTGLSLDVLSQAYYEKGGTLDGKFGETKGGKWLAQHCAEYGFIIRYPKEKEQITAIKYEPWHLRYVGKENAEYIMQHQLSLEEYIQKLQQQEASA